MTDETITELFARYRAAYEAGEQPDMAAALAEAGDDAELLALVLEEYHAVTPAPLDLDAIEALASSPAFAPTFGEVLRAAWTQQGMLRRVLVDRLVRGAGSSARGSWATRRAAAPGGDRAASCAPGVFAAAWCARPGPPWRGCCAVGLHRQLGVRRSTGRARVLASQRRRSHEVADARYARPPRPPEFPEVDELFQAD